MSLHQPGLQGLITEQHLDLAEREFPGIAGFYRWVIEQPEPPRTFLDLVTRFGAFRATLGIQPG